MGSITLLLAVAATEEDGTAVTPADTRGINVYRTTGDAQPVLVGQADLTTSPVQFVDKNLTPGTYAYAFSSIDALGREGKHGDLFPVELKAPPALLLPPTVISTSTSAA